MTEKTRYFITGMGPRGTDKFVRELPVGEALEIKREPTNPHDKNAVQVWARGYLVGYVKAYQAAPLAKMMDDAKTPEIVGTFGITDNSKVPIFTIPLSTAGGES